MKRPFPEQAALKLAVQLLTEHAPAVEQQMGDYRAAQLRLIGMCVGMAAEHTAEGVLRLLAEMDAWRAFFADSAGRVEDADWTARLRDAASPRPPPDSTAEAGRQLDELRTLAIDYQTWVEREQGEDSEENHRIWRLLAAHHRKLPPG